ncbi:MAG: HAD family hydrolase [Lachnospiraceae bacterium]|nr:HAD family hydrolase [Lachnospiraceae bacterium]
MRQSESISSLIKVANRLAKNYEKEATAPENAPKVRIAVLSNFSIQHFTKILRYSLDKAGLRSEIYEGEYGGINMDILDDSSPLYKFAPEIVLLLMRHTDVEVESAEEEIKSLGILWDKLSGIPGVTIFQSNFPCPIERPLGTLESQYTWSSLSLFREINFLLTKNHPSNVKILDLEYLSAYVGKERWFDYTAYYLTKQGFSMDYLMDTADEVTRMVLPMYGMTNKCLCLDLDNTLWDGIVGEDGPLGINLDPNDPIGEAYRAFQGYVKALSKRGVILAINSKNDEANAKEAFEKNPGMVLSLGDISCFRANWEDKASNMSYIARHLNIGMDSIVFFDDNPAEREIIRTYCPGVTVIDVPNEPENFIKALDQSGAFEWSAVSPEDLKRTETYKANEEREALANLAVNYEDYLKALEMRGSCRAVEEAELPRFAQLINKSNQFNLRTVRYKEAEIESMMQDKNFACLAVNLQDRFSEYGLISCIVLKSGKEAEALGFDNTDIFIDTWCMSCRVLKRGVEDFAFIRVFEEARARGAKRIIGEYIPTKKNGMVAGFYAKLGFRPMKDPLNKDDAFARILYSYEVAERAQPGFRGWIERL